MRNGERGSGPEGANDLCLVSFAALGLTVVGYMDIWDWSQYGGI